MKRLRITITPLLLLVAFYSGAQQVRMDTMVNVRPLIRLDMTTPHSVGVRGIPQDHYTQSFGYFCRQELRMQKAHIPVAFRLGSMELTNKLEGKTR